MNFKKEIFLNYFLLIFWMGVIFYLSNQPDLKFGFESQIDFILRKAAHITEYGILTFLAWRAFAVGKETEFLKGNSISKMPDSAKILLGNSVSKPVRFLIYAIIFSVLYAASDEYHQVFVSGRVGSPMDVLIDSVGIVITGVGVWRKIK